jgi:uncharacterized protein (DUF2267 family)
MTHDEFVGQVQARAKLDSRGHAETAIRATLETLAERLEPGIADNIASQLPQEIARHLTTDTTFQRLTLDEFFHRVREREGPSAELPDSTYHARVVMEVLQLAITPAAVEKLRTQFPAEYEPLLSAGSEGKMRVDDRGRADAR